jgi:hypothetical protein
MGTPKWRKRCEFSRRQSILDGVAGENADVVTAVRLLLGKI